MPSLSEVECRERVQGSYVARLATVGPDGSPDLVPLVFALLDDGVGAPVLVSAVDHKPKSTSNLRRLDNVRADPRVTVLVDRYDDDWDRLWWVRIRGAAEVLEGRDPRNDRARAALVDRYPHYRDRGPTGPVLWVTTTEWRGWSAAS